MVSACCPRRWFYDSNCLLRRLLLFECRIVTISWTQLWTSWTSRIIFSNSSLWLTRNWSVFQTLFFIAQFWFNCHKHMSLLLTNGYKIILEQQEYGRGHILLPWHGTFEKERGATSHLRVITVHAYERGGGYSDNHNTSPNLGAKPGF